MCKFSVAQCLCGRHGKGTNEVKWTIKQTFQSRCYMLQLGYYPNWNRQQMPVMCKYLCRSRKHYCECERVSERHQKKTIENESNQIRNNWTISYFVLTNPTINLYDALQQQQQNDNVTASKCCRCNFKLLLPFEILCDWVLLLLFICCCRLFCFLFLTLSTHLLSVNGTVHPIRVLFTKDKEISNLPKSPLDRHIWNRSYHSIS